MRDILTREYLIISNSSHILIHRWLFWKSLSIVTYGPWRFKLHPKCSEYYCLSVTLSFFFRIFMTTKMAKKKKKEMAWGSDSCDGNYKVKSNCIMFPKSQINCGSPEQNNNDWGGINKKKQTFTNTLPSVDKHPVVIAVFSLFRARNCRDWLAMAVTTEWSWMVVRELELLLAFLAV